LQKPTCGLHARLDTIAQTVPQALSSVGDPPPVAMPPVALPPVTDALPPVLGAPPVLTPQAQAQDCWACNLQFASHMAEQQRGNTAHTS
jgi:hypothetical protein